MNLDVSRYREQLDDIGEVDFDGDLDHKAMFFEMAYNKAYAIALAVVELVEEFNEALSQG